MTEWKIRIPLIAILILILGLGCDTGGTGPGGKNDDDDDDDDNNVETAFVFNKEADHFPGAVTNCADVSGSFIAVGFQSQGVRISADGGEVWTQYTNATDPAIINNQVYDVLIDGTSVYLGTFSGLSVIRNAYGSGTLAIENYNAGSFNTRVNSIATDGTQLFLGTNNGVLVISDKDDPAEYAAGEITSVAGLPAGTVTDLFLSGTTLWIAVMEDLFTSDTGGLATVETDSTAGGYLVPVLKSSTLTDIEALYVSGSTVLAGSSNNPVRVSRNGGTSFSLNEYDTSSRLVEEIVSDGTYVYLAQNGSQLHFSADLGTTWTEVEVEPDSGGFFSGLMMNDIAVSGGKLYIAHNGGLRVGRLAEE